MLNKIDMDIRLPRLAIVTLVVLFSIVLGSVGTLRASQTNKSAESDVSTRDRAEDRVERVNVAIFSDGDLAGWEEKSFKGSTNYQLQTDKEHGNVLRAKSNGAASAFGKRVQIDLTETPYLNWEWKIENRLQGLNEMTRSGDDFVARIYVVRTEGLFGRRSKAVNYVWSSNQQSGQSWDNPFKPANAKMIAVRGIEDSPGQWVAEKRNVAEDFLQLFGTSIQKADVVVMMTDTDNSGLSASASYGDIFFSSR